MARSHVRSVRHNGVNMCKVHNRKITCTDMFKHAKSSSMCIMNMFKHVLISLFLHHITIYYMLLSPESLSCPALCHQELDVSISEGFSSCRVKTFVPFSTSNNRNLLPISVLYVSKPYVAVIVTEQRATHRARDRSLSSSSLSKYIR
jgi:hypothetical protein